MLRPVRRVVTGHDARGRSIVLSDGASPHTREIPGQPGRGLTDLWRTFEMPPPIPSRDELFLDPAAGEVVLNPPPGGTVFRFFQVIPEAVLAAMDPSGRARRAEEAFHAMGAGHNRDPGARHPNMHRTETLDCIIVLSGEVTMLLDEGEVLLRPPDVVVQRATNHAWVNHGSEPAVLAAVLMDARLLPASGG